MAAFGSDALPTAAMVRIGTRLAVRWEQAICVGDDFSRLKPGQTLGFGVDSGMAMFADVDAARALTADERAKTHWLETRPLYKAICGGILDRQYANVMVDPSRGLNVVAVRSGWGDGGYATFWGFDEDGAVTALLVDFNLLLPEDWPTTR